MTKHEFFNGAVRVILPPPVDCRCRFAEWDEDILAEEWAYLCKLEGNRRGVPINQPKPPTPQSISPELKVMRQISKGRRTALRIAKAADIRVDRVNGILRSLEAAGLIAESKIILGTYSITPKGGLVWAGAQ